jgi:hypothetical protein
MSSSEEDEYEVEAIRNHNWNTEVGAMEFYIKWKGWPEDQNSWVARESLFCPELMIKYLNRNPEANLKKPPKLSNSTIIPILKSQPTGKAHKIRKLYECNSEKVVKAED